MLDKIPHDDNLSFYFADNVGSGATCVSGFSWVLTGLIDLLIVICFGLGLDCLPLFTYFRSTFFAVEAPVMLSLHL